MTDVLADGILGVSADMLTKLIFDIGADMLTDMDIIAMDAPAITLEFAVGVPGVLTDVLAVPIIDVVTAIAVDMFADENVNGLAPMKTPLGFTLSAP